MQDQIRNPTNRAEFEELRKRLTLDAPLKLRVRSGSMKPLILVDDIIEVQPLAGSPALFDIVVFWNRSVLFCHYVRHINEFKTASNKSRYFVTSGLAYRTEDPPISEADVLGIVVSHRLSFWWKVYLVLRGFLIRQ